MVQAEVSMNEKRAGAMFAFLVAVSLLVAGAFIRLPTFWVLMPSWLNQGLARILNLDVELQEQAANAEFLSAWVLCFAVLAATCVAIAAIRRKR